MEKINNNSLKNILKNNLDTTIWKWYIEKINFIILQDSSSKELYLTYSLCASKINRTFPVFTKKTEKKLKDYLKTKKANLLELSRIYLLAKVLKKNRAFFVNKIKNLIQIADTEELETFLKFLILLPNAKDFNLNAVDALRTNITSVFDAITLNNPYPSIYFNEQQWSQMYLKAAFMERDLSRILNIEKRANKELARIISDYAHERWAASRKIDPEIWRPVTSFLNEILLKDMNKLFNSKNTLENKAAALCCFYSKNPIAIAKLNDHPNLKTKIKNGQLTWRNFKN